MKNSARRLAIQATPAMSRAMGVRMCHPFFPGRMWTPFFAPHRARIWKQMVPAKEDWFGQALKRMENDSDWFTKSFNSPRYVINNDKEKFEIVIDVPGVNAEDISVNLENDGTVLTLSGERESKDDDYSFSSKFSQSFSVDDPTIDVDKLTADLKNGVLTVSAPKDLLKVEQLSKTIPINDLNGKTEAIEPKEANGEEKTTTK